MVPDIVHILMSLIGNGMAVDCVISHEGCKWWTTTREACATLKNKESKISKGICQYVSCKSAIT